MSRRIKYCGAGFRQAVSLHALRMLLLSLLMLVAHGVGADPVLADHELQTVKDSHAQLTALHAFAKSQLQAGQPSGAAFTFATEQAKSKLLAARLAKVEGQNVDSLQRGLYSDAVAQQQAIDHSVAARQLATALQGQFATLVVQPTSQSELAIADAAMAQLSNRLIQLEQAMIASQE